jgi:hypothetical protein
METIKEFIESNPLSSMIVVIVVVIGILLVIKWKQAMRKDNLNDDLDDRDDDDDLDDLEDDEEKPNGRFFVIESYYLPDEWEETFDVIVDRQTKVQYLNYGEYGITPLIDSDGKPILYKDDDEDQEEPE